VRTEDWRAVWLGTAIAVVATLLLTVLAASLESTINGPGRRSVAEPVLWAIGGGAGMALGAIVTGWMTRRAAMAALAASFGGIAMLVLVIVAYNSTDLRFEDQLVGSLLIVVLPAFVGAVLLGAIAALAGRLFSRHSTALPPGWPNV
jgi:peptidoglycan/LPS O-acetylase OafA/YrhL